MTLMVLVAAGRVRCRLAPSRGCCDGGSGLDDQHRDAPGLVKHLVGGRTESGALALPRMGALGADDDEPGARVARHVDDGDVWAVRGACRRDAHSGGLDPCRSLRELSLDLLLELIPHLCEYGRHPKRAAAEPDRRAGAILGTGDDDLTVGYRLGPIDGRVKSFGGLFGAVVADHNAVRHRTPPRD